MSTSFTDFLRRKAEKHQAEVVAGKDILDEWRSAVDRLFAQIRVWLNDADPDGIIEIEEGVEKRYEQGLGHYTVPRLDLCAFEKWVGIVPKARKTIGTATPPQKSAPERAIGRVDITDELRRYVLYRFPGEDGADFWVIDDLQSQPQPLDREAFEKALMSYLR